MIRHRRLILLLAILPLLFALSLLVSESSLVGRESESVHLKYPTAPRIEQDTARLRDLG